MTTEAARSFQSLSNKVEGKYGGPTRVVIAQMKTVEVAKTYRS